MLLDKEIDRPQIIDVKQNFVKKRYNNNDKVITHEDIEDHRQYPLEMQPVLDAVIEYSKRTFSLGILTGSKELDNIVDYLNNLDPNNPQVSQIINYVQDRSKVLKQAFIKGYSQ